ncbi:parallel beta-helix domain-containing protein [Sediminitomix flava]|uniref:Parallel beta-helix repeat protein n=1 Tax=Sediminitomix flava TaxID=379075 RepID=A0A315ZHA7_SEDFL|nr:parallel beta-helix domain-containing protein [Sediminitomix flava]PWJ44901.1 parallel beta-helix repeat protein [Sediminitomix flava]
MKVWHKLAIVFLIGLIAACGEKQITSYDPERSYMDKEKELITKFILAEDSSVIELPEGHFLFSQSLILDGKKKVIIRGQGLDKTVLSFKGQTQGAEGIKIANCENIVLEDFTVEDADGDNIKVSDTDGIIFRRVKVAWTGEITEENGAYGFYPVICNNVIIEECEAQGASDAGIYVGQSTNVVIRNNKAYQNVAGIESENSENVAIYGNEAYDNTGGLLIFDLPGLTRQGKNVSVYNNHIHDNNRPNFGVAGSIVSTIPLGSGLVVLATENVNIYKNIVANQKTVNLAIISYEILAALAKDEEKKDETELPGGVRGLDQNYKTDAKYNPYPSQITIQENQFSNEYSIPSLKSDFGILWLVKLGMEIPDIIVDGILPENYLDENGKILPQYRFCIENNGEALFVSLDAANDFENFTTDGSDYTCSAL